MARLSQHVTNIDEHILKLLEQNKILTVLDFVEEDPDRMCSISGLSFKNVTDIKRDLLSKFAVKSITGFEVYNNVLSTAAKISTGIKSLDCVLEGGFLTGNVYELCGLSGEGKTQICFTIATHISHNLKQTVHFLDSKYDFSAVRIQKMLTAQRRNNHEIRSAMERICVTKIEEVHQLITYLNNAEKITTGQPCRIVIIDSLPVLFTPLISDSNKGGFGLLNHVGQMMKYVAAKFQIVFLVVNLALLSFNSEVMDAQKPVHSEANIDSEINFMGDLKPGLGKAWLHVPTYRLLIQKNETLSSSQRLITLVKSTYIESGKKCVVEINEAGVVSV